LFKRRAIQITFLVSAPHAFGHRLLLMHGMVGSAGMSDGLRNDRIEILNYLKQTVKRMREIAQADPGQFGDAIRKLADDIAVDAAELEAELIEAGLLPRPTHDS
jgi:hypothetical protein